MNKGKEFYKNLNKECNEKLKLKMLWPRKARTFSYRSEIQKRLKDKTKEELLNLYQEMKDKGNLSGRFKILLKREINEKNQTLPK